MWGAPGGPFLDAILPETSHEHPATTLTINLSITWAPHKVQLLLLWVLGFGNWGSGNGVSGGCSWG